MIICSTRRTSFDGLGTALGCTENTCRDVTGSREARRPASTCDGCDEGSGHRVDIDEEGWKGNVDMHAGDLKSVVNLLYK